MTSKITGFAKGMAMGMAAGALVGVVVRPRRKKRSVVKAARAVGEIVENVASGIWG